MKNEKIKENDNKIIQNNENIKEKDDNIEEKKSHTFAEELNQKLKKGPTS